MKLLSSVFFGVCLLAAAPNALAQESSQCIPGWDEAANGTADIQMCLDHCISYCPAEEWTDGFWMSVKRMTDWILDRCECYKLGPVKYERCVRKYERLFVKASAALIRAKTINPGVIPALQDWVDQETKKCEEQGE